MPLTLTKRLFLLAGISCFSAMIPLLTANCAKAESAGKPVTLEDNTRPNIVFILADDMSWYGTDVEMQSGFAPSAGKTRRTPSIHALAKQGMTFSRSFSPAGMCGPSRCSIQTGMSAARTKFSGNGNLGVVSREVSYTGRRNAGTLMLEPSPLGSLASHHATIGERLKSLGYATAHVGKWHIYGGGPDKRGYDISDGETSNDDGNSDDSNDPKKIFSMTAKAISFIEKQNKAGKPFFVQLSHYAEHNAVQFLPETLQACLEDEDIRDIQPVALRKRVASRSAMVEDMDTSIGQLLGKLDELGIRDNTYIVFTSDNGHHRDTGEEKILRGTKWWLWEGGIRVPMIVAGPGVKSGSRCNDNVVGYDFLPTFVEMGGGDIDKLAPSVDGVSLLPLFHGENSSKWADRHLFFHYPHHRNSTPHSAVVQGDFKFLRFYERPFSGYLYDLDRNIGESKNIASVQPEIAEKLEIAMNEYFEAVDASLPKPNPKPDPNYVPFDPDAPQSDDHPKSPPRVIESKPPASGDGDLSEKKRLRQKERAEKREIKKKDRATDKNR